MKIIKLQTNIVDILNPGEVKLKRPFVEFCSTELGSYLIPLTSKINKKYFQKNEYKFVFKKNLYNNFLTKDSTTIFNTIIFIPKNS